MFVCFRTTLLCALHRLQHGKIQKLSEKKKNEGRPREETSLKFSCADIYSGGDDGYCDRSPAMRRWSLIIRFARSQAKLIKQYLFLPESDVV